MMDDGVQFLLSVARGPLFRFAFTLMVLGLLRQAARATSSTVAAYLTLADHRQFRRTLGQRVLWHFLPTMILRRRTQRWSAALEVYHVALAAVSIVFRFGAIVIPAFMVAHVYLWERGLGVGWPALPAGVSDALSVVTLASGFALFVGRFYSPVIRAVDPGWAFLKPLIFLVPFATGMLAMHPRWCPVDYDVVMLVHLLSAAAIFVMIPFARMFTFLHPRVDDLVPEARWPVVEPDGASDAARRGAGGEFPLGAAAASAAQRACDLPLERLEPVRR